MSDEAASRIGFASCKRGFIYLIVLYVYSTVTVDSYVLGMPLDFKREKQNAIALKVRLIVADLLVYIILDFDGYRVFVKALKYHNIFYTVQDVRSIISDIHQCRYLIPLYLDFELSKECIGFPMMGIYVCVCVFYVCISIYFD